MTENPGGLLAVNAQHLDQFADMPKAIKGIPTGYLGLLEQRLNETEEALYRALAELAALKSRANLSGSGDLQIHDLALRDLNTNKHARMAEWKEYPLKKQEELERWQQFMGPNNIQLGSAQEKQLHPEFEESYRSPPPIASNEQRTHETPLFHSLNVNSSGFVRQSLPTPSPGAHIPLGTSRSVEFPAQSPSQEQTTSYPHVLAPNFECIENMAGVPNSDLMQQNIMDSGWEAGPRGGETQDKFRQNPPPKQSERLSAAFQHTYY
ncbi:hypothetical protein BGZ60DRAFT_519762 [Tricladium varicosporioides]|nr:hypothetical protein BGZ60DRAFT_519762 [Hymenoscyphus varicosporioides]